MSRPISFERAKARYVHTDRILKVRQVLAEIETLAEHIV